MWRTKCRDVLIPCMWFAVLWPNKFCYSTFCLLIYLFFAMNINQYGIHMEEYTDPHNNIHLRNVESSHHSLKFLKDSFPPGSCHLPCLWCEVTAIQVARLVWRFWVWYWRRKVGNRHLWHQLFIKPQWKSQRWDLQRLWQQNDLGSCLCQRPH